MAKMSLDDLRKMRDSTKNDLRKREVEGKEVQVIVGMGTCGILAGAKQILEVFINSLDDKNLVDTVMVRQTGCIGMCHSEPTVEIIAPGMPDTLYGKVDENVAKEIIQKHIIGKELVSGHILDRPSVDIYKTK